VATATIVKAPITTTELVFALGIMTARSMSSKIRLAMAAENAGVLLVGLDAYYATCRATSPELGAHQPENAPAPDASLR
jgi:hypothetical protein